MSTSQTPLGINALTRLEVYFSVRHTLRNIRKFSEIFDNDYDLTIIFLAVAEVSLQAIFHLAAVNPEEVDIAKGFNESNAVGLSMLSIGESTGIARETVRRKVHKLIEMGVLAMKNKDKSIYIPMSTLSSPQMLEILSNQASETRKLVKTIRFYSKDLAEG